MIPFLSIFCCDLCFTPRILAADASTGAIVVAAAIIVEGVFFVDVPTVIFCPPIFLVRAVLNSYDYKHGGLIPTLNSTCEFQNWKSAAYFYI